MGIKFLLVLSRLNKLWVSYNLCHYQLLGFQCNDPQNQNHIVVRRTAWLASQYFFTVHTHCFPYSVHGHDGCEREHSEHYEMFMVKCYYTMVIIWYLAFYYHHLRMWNLFISLRQWFDPASGAAKV